MGSRSPIALHWCNKCGMRPTTRLRQGLDCLRINVGVEGFFQSLGGDAHEIKINFNRVDNLLMLVMTASGQRPIRQFTLQDDDSGSRFTFDTSGNYAYTQCGKEIKVEGVGNATISGCRVTFEAIGRFRLVQAEADMCKRSGRASVLLEEEAILTCRLRSALQSRSGCTNSVRSSMCRLAVKPISLPKE